MQSFPGVDKASFGFKMPRGAAGSGLKLGKVIQLCVQTWAIVKIAKTREFTRGVICKIGDFITCNPKHLLRLFLASKVIFIF